MWRVFYWLDNFYCKKFLYKTDGGLYFYRESDRVGPPAVLSDEEIEAWCQLSGLQRIVEAQHLGGQTYNIYKERVAGSVIVEVTF